MQSRFLIRFTVFVTAILAATLTGCGPKTHPVQGQVAFEDGTPAKELVGYTIMFQSQEHQKSADGKIQADGTFTVGTLAPGDGALPGKQRVAITPPIMELDGPRPPALIDAKYGSFDTSNLEIEIKPQTNKVTLKVERKK